MLVTTKDEQNKRSDIISNLNKSMLVEAGAGAGKTRLVVTRNLEQLKKGVLTADQLVDITFTNAAAEELRFRLLNALHNEVDKLTGEEKSRIQKAIKDESLIQISTIHSFCKRLLTEQSFAARLPMDFKLLEDLEATDRKTRFFENWYRDLDKNEIITVEKEYYRGKAGTAIYQTFMTICELPDDTVFQYDDSILSKNTLSDYVLKIKTRLKKVFECMLIAAQNTMPKLGYTSFDDVCNITDSRCRAIVKKDAINAWKILKKSDQVEKNEELIKIYKDILEDADSSKTEIKNLFAGTSINDLGYSCTKNGVNHSEDAYEDFKGLIGVEKNLLIDLSLYQNALIVDMAMKARKAYRSFCKLPENRHEITNDGLLQEALNLVKNDIEARKYFQSKFSCIYVDEFQDTDLVQRELVEILCQDPDDPSKRREGSLFFVGDPKQSIYAFRGADVDVYLDFKEKNAKSDVADLEEYVLDDNYRSEKPIIDWVNDYFETKFGMDSIVYSRMNHKVDNPDGDKVIRGVYKLSYPNWAKESKKPYVYDGRKVSLNKGIDCKLLTTLIQHLVSEHFQIWDETENGSEMVLRDIQYKDFLVLCLKKKDINIYADQLKEVGIPTNLCGAIDNENDEILLRALQLVKVLANPYCNWKAIHGAKEVLLSGRITNENEAEGEKRLLHLQEITKKMSASEVLQFIVHHPEYLLKDESTGAEVVMAQSRLQQMLEAVQASACGDLQDIVKRIEAYMKTGSDKELSLEKNQDAVRLMNLHKAKGLEGKIVIICARSTRKAITKDAYHSMQEYYPFAGSGNTGFASYLNDSSIIKKAKIKEEQERIRLDYVEATRAEEALIFMDSLKNNCIFNDADFSNAKDLLKLSNGIKNDIESIYKDPSKKLDKTTTNTVTYDGFPYNEPGDPNQSICIARSITPSGMEDTKEQWDPGEEKGRPYSSVFGTVLHRCFELMIKILRNNEMPIVISVINQAIMENYIDVIYDGKDDQKPEDILKLYKNYLEDRMNLFLSDTDLQKKIKDAKSVYTELSFSQYADKDQIEKVNSDLAKYMNFEDETLYWINGKADLVLVNNDDSVEIIDYKSDHIGNKTMAEFQKHLSDKYDPQQELYRFALSEMLGIDVDNISYKYYHLYADKP